MPQMGVSVSEGTVTKWLKQQGEAVALDEPLLEISTDKVDTEVPSPGEGIVAQILVPEGTTVEVGTVLAVIAPAGAAITANGPQTPTEQPAAAAARGGSRARCRQQRPSPRRRPSRRSARRPRRRSVRSRRLQTRATAARSCPPSWHASPPSTGSTRTPSRARARAAA